MTTVDYAAGRVRTPDRSVDVAEKPDPAGVEPQLRPVGQPGRRHEALVVAGQGLTVFGLIVAAFVVYLLTISALEHGRAQATLRTRFSRDVGFGNAWIGGRIPEGAPVARLAISRIGVDEIVVEGTTGALLRTAPGHLRTAPLPGQTGNVVIAGRRATFGAPFRHVDRLRRGDLIVATTGQGRASYRVRKVVELSRRAPDAVDDFGDNRLTLITSAPELQASRRLVVTAVLQSAPRSAQGARPVDVRPSELGLNRDPSTTYALLLWAQALLLASLATAWLSRRWRRWPTYLVALPVLALLVLLVFDSFAPVLPSTL